MKVAYFDLIGGASGNMILGALVDAGLDENALRAMLDLLRLPGWSLESARVMRAGITATLVEVRIQEDSPERRASDLLETIAAGALPAPIKEASTRILTRLAQVEARIHNQSLADVHLHELGGLDTIIDIVGAVAGTSLLGVERVCVSPFPLARGQIKTEHGVFPLPAPATLALLQDAPLVGVSGDRETVTPTGAAILTTLADTYGSLPRMLLRAVGYGAGSRQDTTPNVLRVLTGEAAPSAEQNTQSGFVSGDLIAESIVELETNIDDMNPQIYDHLMERLFHAGALDVTLTPLQMKKNRPGTCLRVLGPVGRTDGLLRIVFEETTTLGIREHILQRYVLPREGISVETEYGTLRAKVARRPDGRLTIVPEYDDCARAARDRQLPLSTIMDAVRRAATRATSDGSMSQ